MENPNNKKKEKLLFLFAVFAGIIMPLLTNFAGSYFAGLYEITSENGSSASLFKTMLGILAVFSLYIYSGCLLLSVFLFGSGKRSSKIIAIGALRIVIIYISAFFVQFTLSENFADYALKYFEDTVMYSLLIDISLLLGTVFIALIFRRISKKDKGFVQVRGLFNFKNTYVQSLLVLLALFLSVSLVICIGNTLETLSLLDGESISSLDIDDYIILSEPYVQLIFKAVCGYFANIALLAYITSKDEETADMREAK